MQEQGELYCVVVAIGWVVMHLCGAQCRMHCYTDSFFYDPEERE